MAHRCNAKLALQIVRVSGAVSQKVTNVSNSHSYDQRLQAEGLACPMPLLKAKLALKSMGCGQVLWLSATDAGSWRDMHTLTELTGHQMLAAEQRDDVYHYWIQKGE